jgi:transcriptional/translational regulatory protein YebC/TACO1
MDIPVESAELIMVPQNEVALDDRDAVQILKLIANIEELDDVNRVFANLEMTEEAIAAFTEATA